jgi:hypothetical protein
MTDPADILAAYKRHEQRLGSPDMVKEALAATADELRLTYTAVYDVILYSPLMAGSGGRG